MCHVNILKFILMKLLFGIILSLLFVDVYSQKFYNGKSDSIEAFRDSSPIPHGDLEVHLFENGNGYKDYVVRYPGSHYVKLQIKNVGDIPMSNWSVEFYLSKYETIHHCRGNRGNRGNRDRRPQREEPILLSASINDYANLDRSLEPGKTFYYSGLLYLNTVLHGIISPSEGGDNYYLVAKIKFINSPGFDENRCNNEKSLWLTFKPKIARSVSEMNIVNNRSTISFSNLNDKYLDSKLFISSINGGNMREFNINKLDDIIIDNKWRYDDVLLIRIQFSDGDYEVFKIKNR